MNEKRFFADVDLPFHVWVREGRAGQARWVLRHASEIHGADATGSGTASDAAPGRRPRSPL
jgi:hypothetical protein